MSKLTIKEFFKLNKITVDKKLYKKLHTFRVTWATKSEDSLNFLGGKLLGVDKFTFSLLDDDMLASDVFGYDYMDALQKDFYEVEEVNKEFKIISNLYYQTLFYIASTALRDKSLNKELKEDIVKEAVLIMEYKMFSSMYNRSFSFNVPSHIALQVYNKLNRKHLIKRYDNWNAVFVSRAEKVLVKDNLFNDRLLDYTLNHANRFISGLQVKLKSQLKIAFRVLLDVKDNDETLLIDSNTFVNADGVKQLVDSVDGINKNIEYMISISLHKEDFIHNDIVEIMTVMFKKIKRELIYKLLIGMSDEKYVKSIDDHNKLIREILILSYSYLQRINIDISDPTQLEKALVSIRYFFSSSTAKSADGDLNGLREQLKKKVKLIMGIKGGWKQATLVQVYLVYVFLRNTRH